MTRGARETGNVGALTYRSGNGPLSVKTTLLTGTAGIISRTIMRAAVPTAGAKMGCSVLPIASVALLCARSLEWEGPDPKGAPIRSHRLRGESRRGRKGALLLPRLDADAFLHEGAVQISAGGISVCASRRGKSAARSERNRV